LSFVDKTLTCADCGADFTFTAGEQEFHASKGFTHEPRRCPSCRSARRGQSGGGSYAGGGSSYGAPREMFTATCSSCGQEARVPFQPRGDKPVYCSDCFRSRQGSSSYGSGSYGSGGGSYGSSRGGNRW
jgi:CxxC-x17-CxxC domain-containing protein